MAVSANRKAGIELGVGTRNMDPGIREARRKLRAFEREQAAAAKARERADARQKKEWAGRTGGAGSSLVGAAKGVGFGLATMAGLDLAGGLVGMASGLVDTERQLTRLQVTGEMSSAQLVQFRAEMLRVSEATGVSTSELLAGASAYVGFTGNTEAASKSLELFARVAKATNAPMTAIAGVAATLDKNMHLDPSEWGAAFDILIKQGHMGGVELDGMADSFAKVGAMYASVFEGGASTKGLREVSAMGQVLQNLTHDSQTTATYLTDFFGDITHNAKAIRALGIEPFRVDPKTKKKVLKDGLDLLHAFANSKAAKDPELLQKLFPEKRGRMALDYLMANVGEVDRINTASTDSNQTAKDYAIYQESAAGRIEVAMNRVKVAITAAFTPERAAAFASMLETVGNDIAKIIGWLGDLPDALDRAEKRSQTGKYSDYSIDLAHEEADKYADASPAEKKARAIELRKMEREADRAAGAITGDDPMSQAKRLELAARASGYGQAADDLSMAANPNQHGDYQGVRTSVPTFKTAIPQVYESYVIDVGKKIGQGILDMMTKPNGINIVVKADTNAIAKAGSNAPIHSRRPGGHR